jgi:hypothetical protein
MARRCRNAKLRHLTYCARKVPQLSPAENQKQRRKKETRRENELTVETPFMNMLYSDRS